MCLYGLEYFKTCKINITQKSGTRTTVSIIIYREMKMIRTMIRLMIGIVKSMETDSINENTAKFLYKGVGDIVWFFIKQTHNATQSMLAVL